MDQGNKLGLERTIRHLRAFNNLDTKMQVSTILTLLEIALAEAKREAISPMDLEKRIGMLSGTSSRNVYYWAEGHKDMRGGHHLVDVQIDPVDRRKRSLRLSHKGRAFLHSLID